MIVGFFLITYFNLVVYLHLRELTTMQTVKDYFKYNYKVNLIMNLTALLILFSSEFIHSMLNLTNH
jgi:hypothetical protein